MTETEKVFTWCDDRAQQSKTVLVPGSFFLLPTFSFPVSYRASHERN